ncbi:MAG: outer membrane protein assembly factor BamA [Planctomycetota bacterium]
MLLAAAGWAGWLLLPCCASEPTKDAPTAIEWRGNRALSARALRREVEDSLIVYQRSRKVAAIDDAAFAIAERYRREGYADVEVTYDVDQEGARVRFEIVEGARVVLRSVSIDGNTRYPDAELQDYFQAPAEGLLEWRNDAFVETAVVSAIGQIAERYHEDGYLDASTSDYRIDRPDRETAVVQVHVHEGSPYHIGRLLLDIDPADLERYARAKIVPKDGDPYFPRLVSQIKSQLVIALRSRGYPDAEAQVRPILDRDAAQVTVLVRAMAGKKALIRGFKVDGLERTSERVVMQELSLAPGDSYDGEALDRSVRALFRAGLFSQVRVSHEWVDDRGVLIHIQVTERDARSISFLAGWGSYELLRGKVTYADRNLFGSGRRLSTSVQASIKSARYDLSLTEPHLFGSAFSGTIAGYSSYRRNPSFTVREGGASLSLDRDWTPHLASSFGYGYKRSSLVGVPDADVPVDLIVDQLGVGAVFVKLRYDRRDSPLVPRAGFDVITQVDFAHQWLASEIDFTRVNLGGSYLVPLGQRTVLAFGARGGVILPQGDTDAIPLQERFFNGGENTVRSFREDDLGPKDERGNPIGGEYYTVWNTELRLPLRGPLGVTVFADAGNVGLHARDLGLSDLRYAVGAGLRYDLPIGPIRLDWGKNPSPRHDEDSWALHFSVGFASLRTRREQRGLGVLVATDPPAAAGAPVAAAAAAVLALPGPLAGARPRTDCRTTHARAGPSVVNDEQA